MITNGSKADSLQNFGEELKKTTNCSDEEVDQFIDFLDNGHQVISRKESLEIPN